MTDDMKIHQCISLPANIHDTASCQWLTKGCRETASSRRACHVRQTVKQREGGTYDRWSEGVVVCATIGNNLTKQISIKAAQYCPKWPKFVLMQAVCEFGFKCKNKEGLDVVTVPSLKSTSVCVQAAQGIHSNTPWFMDRRAFRDQHATQGHFVCGGRRCNCTRPHRRRQPITVIHQSVCGKYCISRLLWFLQETQTLGRLTGRCSGTDTSDKEKIGQLKSMSDDDACCHGDWGQWVVAMECTTWNCRGEFLFFVHLCVENDESMVVIIENVQFEFMWVCIQCRKQLQQ